jgi:hypothetical protein
LVAGGHILHGRATDDELLPDAVIGILRQKLPGLTAAKVRFQVVGGGDPVVAAI